MDKLLVAVFENEKKASIGALALQELHTDRLFAIDRQTFKRSCGSAAATTVAPARQVAATKK